MVFSDPVVTAAMKVMLRFFLFLLLSATSGPIWAARISGRITDTKGEVLPYASVMIQGTTEGTSANAEGVYVLQLNPGKYKLIARQIGYVQAVYELTVSGTAPVTHDFILQEQGYQLQAVVIRSDAEDPAYRIIRNAIKRRSFHLNQLYSFQSGIYVKGVLRNRRTPDKVMGIRVREEDKKDMNGNMGLDSAGRGVIYLCEEVADFYSAGKDKQKVIIRSVTESGNPNGVGLGQVPHVVNFYENNVITMAVNGANGQGTLSPISNNALNYYKYKLAGDFQENGTTIYKIRVTPKRLYERCFTGDIYIVDGEWAIHSLSLFITKTSGLDLLDTVRTEQQYIPLAKDQWVIKSQVLYPTIALLGFDISGNFVSVYDRQKVNEPIPDSIFNTRVVVSYDTDANKKDSAYWNQARLMDLEKDEQRNYVYKDSIHKIESDPARMDSLRRRGNRLSAKGILIGGQDFHSRGFKNTYGISPLLLDINFNTVEGWNYAPALRSKHMLRRGNYLQAGLDMRYGFSNTRFNAKGSLKFSAPDPLWAGREWTMGLSGGKYISQFNPAQPVPELFNTFSSLVQQVGHFKIFERWFVRAELGRSYGNGLSWSADLSYQKRLPLQNTTDFSWANAAANDPYTVNLPAELAAKGFTTHEAITARASISYNPGYKYTEFPGGQRVGHAGKWPLFTLSYQKGIPDVLNSVTDYDRWRFQVKDNIGLRLAGSIDYQLACGGFLNDRNVQIPDMMHLTGNRYFLATSYLSAFQLAPYYRFSNTARLYGEAHVEYFLKGLLTNKIPLLRQAQLYFVLGSNAFYTEQGQYYAEAFIGVDNLGFKIFRMFRLDYIQGWDSGRRTYSGVRLGMHTSGMRKTEAAGKAGDF